MVDTRKGTCDDPEVAARRSDNPIVSKIQEGLCNVFSATMAPNPVVSALSATTEPKVEVKQQPAPQLPAGPGR